eukprot:TRINITY_DN5789_c0_g1_i1.p1 TRINITY_DN5789_c0_g1~~TRINITY_DN5789_c0_g1_i1.p1  ORF type:complete len:413 (-),score=62.06 TRINITY_DN5789_c0_g1_i1:1422-2660(-)
MAAPRVRQAYAGETRPSKARTFQHDGGSIEYLHVDDFLAGNTGQPPPVGGFDASTAHVPAGGWPDAGPGRAEGSGLNICKSLGDVLVVLFAAMAYRNLEKRFDGSQQVFRSMAALRMLRRKYKHVTYATLRGRAWDLAPSGAIGVVLKFGGVGPRNAQGQHEIFVAAVSLTEGEIACACSEEERCLGAGGCPMRPSIVSALRVVHAAMDVDLVDLLTVLGASVKERRLRAGRRVIYGEKVCVVRNSRTSWPLSAVHRTRGGSWILLSCRTGDKTCDHAGTAVAAAKADADGFGDDSSDSDVEENEDNEARLLKLAGLSATADQEACGAAELPPHLPAPTEPRPADNRFKWESRSHASRQLSPSQAAQQERASSMRALRDPPHKVRYPAGAQCPFCHVGRAGDTDIETRNGNV